jgi:hypothetical protein
MCCQRARGGPWNGTATRWHPAVEQDKRGQAADGLASDAARAALKYFAGGTQRECTI